VKTHVLSFHAPYACRSTGACCSSGWPIPVEPPIARRVRDGLGSGRLALPVRSRARDPIDGELLVHDAQGRCAFFDDQRGRLCAIHRDLGHDGLPSACRHFPRIALLRDGGVWLTLSHYCPTAASLLFEASAPVTIVEDAPRFPPAREYEGLDVRGAAPPLLRPGVLMGQQAYERFERHCVETLCRGDLGAEAALARLTALAESLRTWTPASGELDDVLQERRREDIGAVVGPPAEVSWADAIAAVPEGLVAPSLPAGWRDDEARWVAVSWTRHTDVACRYLAARAFASWCAFQGDGLRTTLRALWTALSVLRVECARGCAEAGRPLDALLLKQAIRRSDLLLAHLVAPDRLARRLSACEREP
jgi:Fe-S-cluster containining protein